MIKSAAAEPVRPKIRRTRPLLSARKRLTRSGSRVHVQPELVKYRPLLGVGYYIGKVPKTTRPVIH